VKKAERIVTAVRMKASTRAALRKAGEVEKRNMGNLIEYVIEQWLEERGYLK